VFLVLSESTQGLLRAQAVVPSLELLQFAGLLGAEKVAHLLVSISLLQILHRHQLIPYTLSIALVGD
jgi:hypothetical protein